MRTALKSFNAADNTKKLTTHTNKQLDTTNISDSQWEAWSPLQQKGAEQDENEEGIVNDVLHCSEEVSQKNSLHAFHYRGSGSFTLSVGSRSA